MYPPCYAVYIGYSDFAASSIRSRPSIHPPESMVNLGASNSSTSFSPLSCFCLSMKSNCVKLVICHPLITLHISGLSQSQVWASSRLQILLSLVSPSITLNLMVSTYSSAVSYLRAVSILLILMYYSIILRRQKSTYLPVYGGV